MSETATISSSDSGRTRRCAVDLSTVPMTSSPTLRLTAAAAQSFIMNEKFIYATSTVPATATYHLATRNTRTGKPWQLSISHLLPSEVRRLSTTTTTTTTESSSTTSSSATATPSSLPFIKYDDDLTLYTGERITVPLSIGQKPLLCIRGRRRGTVPGTVVVEKTLGRSRTYKFWHMTTIHRALSEAETERMQALMHRRGYRTSDDWRKELLYTAQGKGSKEMGEMEWTNAEGEVVASERDGQLMILGQAEEGEAERDLLIACWASRNFVQSVPADEE